MRLTRSDLALNEKHCWQGDLLGNFNGEAKAPGKSSRVFTRTLTHENWLGLSAHGRHVCRHIKLAPGETPPQLLPHTWEGKQIPDRRPSATSPRL